MNKRMICTQCPKGCALSVTIEQGKVVSVRGNECERGVHYAHQEIEDPRRILTAAVLAEGLMLKMVPVRTDKPIPKHRLFEGMEYVRTVRLTKPVKIGDVIVPHFLGLNVDLIATRSAE
jgi:CxxC motif-containing protein